MRSSICVPHASRTLSRSPTLKTTLRASTLVRLPPPPPPRPAPNPLQNGVCSNMMVMERRKLRYWGGNYDTYIKTRTEQDSAQEKEYKKQQEYITDTKQFISSCGTYANLVRQAKSRQKILDKMYEEGLVEFPYREPVFRFRFPETNKLPPPLISATNVAFSYSGKKEDYLFTGLNFGIDSDSRIALVGPNGAGKSTLLKLMVGEHRACEGNMTARGGIIIGRYHQHSAEVCACATLLFAARRACTIQHQSHSPDASCTQVLDLEATPVEYIERKFKDKLGDKQQQEWRSLIGSFGVPSLHHLVPIKVRSARC